MHYFKKRHKTLPYRIFSAFVAVTFITGVVLPPSAAAQVILNLPAPGTMVVPSGGFIAPRLIGVTIHPDNPLKFDFIVNSGDDDLAPDVLKEESRKLIKYFLASLTVPEDELWVNLSPYEKDRMIPQGLGDTEMGRDMLAQDYLLKQLTASLMYPEKELGQKFWEKIYKEAREKYGTTEIPVNTFNKVWVVPREAVVYEKGTSAYVVKSRLRVMLEEDYQAMSHKDTKSSFASLRIPRRNPERSEGQGHNVTGDVVTTGIIREIILPAIEQEVNEGENFASLRQMYHSLILAAWYKLKLKDGLLGKIYVDRNKTKGIDTEDKTVNQKIYDQYLESFKKGVYNYIKEDVDPATQDVIPRKYFSGGIGFNAAQQPNGFKGILAMVGASLVMSGASVPPAYATDMVAQVEKGNNSSVEVVLGENPLKSAEETLAALEPPLDEQSTNDETSSSPVRMKFSKEEMEKILKAAGRKSKKIPELTQEVLRLWGDADFLVALVKKNGEKAYNDLKGLKTLGEFLEKEGLIEAMRKDIVRYFKKELNSYDDGLFFSYTLAELSRFIMYGEMGTYIDHPENPPGFILSRIERYAKDEEKFFASRRGYVRLLSRILLNTSRAFNEKRGSYGQFEGFEKTAELLYKIDAQETINILVQILKEGRRDLYISVSEILIDLLGTHVFPGLSREEKIAEESTSEIEASTRYQLEFLKKQFSYLGNIGEAREALKRLDKLNTNVLSKVTQSSNFLN